MKKQTELPTVPPKACGCHDRREAPFTSASVELKRLERAIERADQLLRKKMGAGRDVKLSEARVHTFDRGFGVGSWQMSETRLVFAGVGVVDKMPTEASLAFDLAFFKGESKKNPNILWLEFESMSPVPRAVKIPLRGNGVLRDHRTGHILKVDGFEVATDLVSDLGDIAVVIACILACVGLFCAAICAPLCVAIIACIACLGTCVGARLPLFLSCVRACGIAVEDIGDALA